MSCLLNTLPWPHKTYIAIITGFILEPSESTKLWPTAGSHRIRRLVPRPVTPPSNTFNNSVKARWIDFTEKTELKFLQGRLLHLLLRWWNMTPLKLVNCGKDSLPFNLRSWAYKRLPDEAEPHIGEKYRFRRENQVLPKFQHPSGQKADEIATSNKDN